MFVSLIFPCLNEEQAIPVFLPKIILAGKHLLKTTNLKGLEILVVDDGSTDRSLEFLQKHQEDISVLSLKTQEGYGSAIQQGIKKAKGDWIAFCDLDDTCEPEELKNLIELIQSESLQVAWGNRLNKNSQMPFIRQLGNRLYQLTFLFLSFRFIPDPCSGFRLFKKSSLAPQIYEFPKDLSFFSSSYSSLCPL